MRICDTYCAYLDAWATLAQHIGYAVSDQQTVFDERFAQQCRFARVLLRLQLFKQATASAIVTVHIGGEE